MSMSAFQGEVVSAGVQHVLARVRDLRRALHGLEFRPFGSVAAPELESPLRLPVWRRVRAVGTLFAMLVGSDVYWIDVLSRLSAELGNGPTQYEEEAHGC